MKSLIVLNLIVIFVVNINCKKNSDSSKYTNKKDKISLIKTIKKEVKRINSMKLKRIVFIYDY